MMHPIGGATGTPGGVQQQDPAGAVVLDLLHPLAQVRGSGWAEGLQLLQDLSRYLQEHLARLLTGKLPTVQCRWLTKLGKQKCTHMQTCMAARNWQCSRCSILLPACSIVQLELVVSID